MKSAIKIPGGKAYLAKWIVSLMPPRCKNPNKPSPRDKGWLHYVEPFFGSGAVLFEMDQEGIGEVACDMALDLVGFWIELQSKSGFRDFSRLVSAIPFSRQEFDQQLMEKMIDTDGYSIGTKKAASFFVRCRQSLAGRMDSFTGITKERTRRGMNAEASAWLSAIDGLPEVHERLSRVLIEKRPALDCIKAHDGKRTLFYCDPPYVHGTRVTRGEYGLHEMTDEDHADLLALLNGIKGRFILSGYHHPLYDGQAAASGWKCHEKAIDNKASHQKSKPKKIECCWTNY